MAVPGRISAGPGGPAESALLPETAQHVGHVKGSRSSRTSNIVPLAWTFDPHAFQESPVEH